MTLILSLAAPPFAVQVADRMVTYLGTGEVKNANATKMVQYCNRASFAFTGLAELEGMATDSWLAKVIADSPSQDLAAVCTHLVQRAGQACLRPEVTRLKRPQRRLAFVGVGFTRTWSNEPFYPILVRISNFHDRGGRVQDTQYELSLQYAIYKPPAPPHSGFLATGAELTREEASSLHKLLARCSKRGTGPAPIVRLFRDTIRKVADRQKWEGYGKPSVGKDLLVGVLPRSTADLDGGVIMGPKDPLGYRSGVILNARALLGDPRALDDFPVFLDLPADRADGVLSSPLLACPGMSFAGPLRIVPGP